MDELRMLRAEIHARGLDTPQPGRVLLELGWHLLVSAAGVWLIVAADHLLLRLAGVVVWALGNLGVQSNTHNSTHATTSERRWVNAALTWFGTTVLMGVSTTFWRNKHLVVHHPRPNVIGVDDDADLMPFFAVYQPDVEAATGLRRLYYRLQIAIIPFALGFIMFQMQLNGWKYLVPRLLDPAARRPAHWLDLAMIGVHYVGWIVVPALFFPLGDVLALYALCIAVAGYMIFAGAAPAHMPAEAACVEAAQKNAPYVLRQTATTVNYRTGFLGHLLCSGIQYQIEHHLLPDICYTRYPAISPIVERFCRERGYPYRRLGWAEGCWKALVIFCRPKPIHARLEQFRQAGDGLRHGTT